MHGTHRTGWLAAAALAAPLAAQDPAIVKTIVVMEGDTIAGVGDVTGIFNVAVNANGDTLVEADTNNADTDTDSVLLSNGGLLLREGQALAAPAGATLDSFDSLSIDDLGNFSQNLFLDGTTGSNDDSGVFIGSTLLFQEGSFSTATGFSPSTPLIGFFDTKLNNNGTILLRGSADDPLIASTVDAFLMTIDGGTQTLVIKEGDEVPGHPGVFVANLGSSAENNDLNDAGEVLYFIDSDATTSEDGFIFLDDTELAREGQPSPVAGRNWSSLSSPELSLNADGDTVFSGSLDGDTSSNLLIVKNGQKFRQEGDSLPGTGGFTFTSFGSAPILLADRAVPSADPDVLWYGDWNDTDTDVDTGLFLDGKLIVQEGVTEVGGMIVDSISSFSETLAFSSNGRYAIADVAFVGSLDAALLLDFGPWDDLGNGTPGTTAPKMRGFGQLSAGSEGILRLEGALPNTPVVLVVGASQINLPLLGATLVPFPNRSIFYPGTDANGVLEIPFVWPTGIASGFELFLQFWAADPGAANGFGVSNGIRGTTP